MTQVQLEDLLGPSLYESAAEIAQERDVAVDQVIREALDRGLRRAPNRRTAAGARILAAEPMEVGSVEDLVAELDEVRGRRA